MRIDKGIWECKDIPTPYDLLTETRHYTAQADVGLELEEGGRDVYAISVVLLKLPIDRPYRG